MKFLIVLLFFSQSIFAVTIKDISNVVGIRDNQLIGYGLVVGLDGTGEKTKYTEQTFRTMLGRFGINVPALDALRRTHIQRNRACVFW